MKQPYERPSAINEANLTGIIPVAAISVGPLTAALIGGMIAGVAAGKVLGDNVRPKYKMQGLLAKS